MIKFDRVSKRFGTITALEEVSFEVADKEFVFVIGPSGAGKTTLVRLLLGDYLPSSGQVKVSGFDPSQLKPKELAKLRRKMGVVFQDYKLLPDRTVYENVALALSVLGKKREEVGREVRNVLSLVGLVDRAELFPAQLAGGELQRVCLARAVVAQPQIVVADEPTGNLDPATGWQIVKLLKKINEMGRTVIMMTHNFEVVNSLRERVLEFDKGKLISDKKRGKYKPK